MANTKIDFTKYAVASQAQTFSRKNPVPLDKSSIFDSLDEAKAYAASCGELTSIAYPGQIVKVVTDNDVKVYVIDNKELKTIGGGATQVDSYNAAVDAATSDNVGSIIYLTADDEVDDVTYTAGAYIVTGARTIAKLGTTDASGDLAGAVTSLQGTVGTAVSKADDAQAAADAAQSAADAAQTAADDAQAAADDAQTTADAAVAAIAKLNGTGDGSVSKTVGDAIADLDLSNTYADKSLETTVGTLVGNDANKSVRDIAAEEVASIVNADGGDIDTLEEIANWIKSDTTGAAKMASDIESIKGVIGNDVVYKTDADGNPTDEVDKPASGFYGRFATKDELTAAVNAAISANNTTLGNDISAAQDAADAAQSAADDAQADATAALDAIGDENGGLVKDVADLKSSTANTASKTETSTDSLVTVSVTTANGGVTAVTSTVTTATSDDIEALFAPATTNETTNE